MASALAILFVVVVCVVFFSFTASTEVSYSLRGEFRAQPTTVEACDVAGDRNDVILTMITLLSSSLLLFTRVCITQFALFLEYFGTMSPLKIPVTCITGELWDAKIRQRRPG